MAHHGRGRAAADKPRVLILDHRLGIRKIKSYGMEESLRASGASIRRRRVSKVVSENHVDDFRTTLNPHSTGTTRMRVVRYMIYMIFIE
jgi:hypothetical protein